MNNILICDDERDIVSAVKIYLTAEGFNVFEAYNGKEAIDVINREMCSLFFLML